MNDKADTVTISQKLMNRTFDAIEICWHDLANLEDNSLQSEDMAERLAILMAAHKPHTTKED